MKFEVVETCRGWVVQCEGEEIARFEDQDQALNEVAARLRNADATAAASLAVRYQRRG